MKSALIALGTCVTLAACSQHFRNGEVRSTPPEMLAGAHADPHAKPTAKAAEKTDAKSKADAAESSGGN
ncbi:MAG: hypothetical protein JSS28_06500 [Proteobacteria bacterium]|nr:hypothetical protein [Pseudomonadota bacterium]